MVLIRVPATTANLGPGFDTLGMALDMYNYMELFESQSGLTIEVSGEGKHKIPKNISNLAIKSAFKVFEKINYSPKGLTIKMYNNIPLGKGLGSSAAVIIGGMVAANIISGQQLDSDQLLNMASSMEGHPDNVAPALLGGIVVSAQLENEIVYRIIKPPPSLHTVVAIPDYELQTRKARNVLPKEVPLANAVFNLSRTGLLLWAFLNEDLSLLSKVMDDRLHQPYRMSLVPGLENVFSRAKEEGALSVALSGAGPAVIAFSDNSNTKQIGEAMKEGFKEKNVDCTIKYLRPITRGTEIIDMKGEYSYEHYCAKIRG
ncbi:MAG: homoserine kinase [Bacillota bacterium]